MNYLVIDLETTSKEVFGRTANFKYNEIVAVGYMYNGFKPSVHYQYRGKQDLQDYFQCGPTEHIFKALPDLFANIDILVAHNAKFDLLYLWKEPNLQDWLKAGGKIWDTQLAHYWLTQFKEKYPALREIAIKDYGCQEREKLMESYWQQGIDTKDIPKDIVLQDVLNDVLDTEKIYLKQIDRAKALGIDKVLEIQMDCLLSTTEMEYNGFYIDKQRLKNNKEELINKLNHTIKELNDTVKSYWITFDNTGI